MPTAQTAYALLGLTAVVAALAGVLAFAASRFVWEARDARSRLAGPPRQGESDLVAAALAKALGRAAARSDGSGSDARGEAAWYRELAALLAERAMRGVAEARRAMDAGAGSAASPSQRGSVEGVAAGLLAIDRAAAAVADLARSPLSTSTVDLYALVQHAASDHRPAARSRGGDITVDGRFAPVAGDESMLRHAISHLVQRALAACERIGAAPVVTIAGRVEDRTGGVHVTIADNGPGPVEGAADVDAGTRAHSAGDDIQLALVRRIVLAHGGAYTSRIGPMGGDQIDIELPRPARA